MKDMTEHVQMEGSFSACTKVKIHWGSFSRPQTRFTNKRNYGSANLNQPEICNFFHYVPLHVTHFRLYIHSWLRESINSNNKIGTFLQKLFYSVLSVGRNSLTLKSLSRVDGLNLLPFLSESKLLFSSHNIQQSMRKIGSKSTLCMIFYLPYENIEYSTLMYTPHNVKNAFFIIYVWESNYRNKSNLV